MTPIWNGISVRLGIEPRACAMPPAAASFGWRSGTGTWPAYFEDSLPPAVEIGPGSPTGVLFGTGTKFPARYQKAMFILDWTYSTIYTIDLAPNGSTYSGTKADFITGSPMPVTDAVVGLDGALYYAVGGRGTQSSIYRVTYTGNESTAAVSGHDAAGAEKRELRRKLEATHGHAQGDVNLLINYLGDEDRFIRYAARVGLENQPISSWRDAVGKLKTPKAIVSAAIALAHQGKPEDQSLMLERLGQLNLSELAEDDLLGALRAYELAFTRLGHPAMHGARNCRVDLMHYIQINVIR